MDKTQQDKNAGAVKVEDIYIQHSEKLTPGRKWWDALRIGGLTGAFFVLTGQLFSERHTDKLVEAIEEHKPHSEVSKLAEKLQTSRFWVGAIAIGASLIAGVAAWFASKRVEDNAMRVAKGALEEKKRGFLAEHPELNAAPAVPVVIGNPAIASPGQGNAPASQPVPPVNERYPVPIMDTENEPSMKVQVSADTEVSAAEIAAPREVGKA